MMKKEYETENPWIKTMRLRIESDDDVTFVLHNWELDKLFGSGDILTLKQLLRNSCKQKLNFIFTGKSCSVDFQILKRKNLEVFDKFHIPKEYRPDHIKGTTDLHAIVLGVGKYLFFYIQGENGESHGVTCWSSIETLADLKMNKFKQIPLQNQEIKPEIIEYSTETTVSERFYSAIIEKLMNNDAAQAVRMLQCLLHRYSHGNFNIKLPLDDSFIPELNFLNNSPLDLFNFIVLWDQCLIQVAQYLKQEENLEELRKNLLKTWLMWALEQNMDVLTQELLKTNTTLPGLSYEDLPTEEMYYLLSSINSTTIIEKLFLSGLIGPDDNNAVTDALLFHNNKEIVILAKSADFYFKAMNCKTSLECINLLTSAALEQNGIIFVGKLFQNQINSIRNFGADTNFLFMRNLLKLFHIICLDPGNDPQKYSQLFDSILCELLAVDFDAIKNKSLFQSNKEMYDFIKSSFPNHVVALENMKRELTEEEKKQFDIPETNPQATVQEITSELFIVEVMILAHIELEYEKARDMFKGKYAIDLTLNELEMLKFIKQQIENKLLTAVDKQEFEEKKPSNSDQFKRSSFFASHNVSNNVLYYKNKLLHDLKQMSYQCKPDDNNFNILQEIIKQVTRSVPTSMFAFLRQLNNLYIEDGQVKDFLEEFISSLADKVDDHLIPKFS